MIDQLFEGFRKASESSLQMQRDAFKNWTQQWLSGPANTASVSTEWHRTLQKRWITLTIEILKKNRESFDSAAQSGIEVIEQMFHVVDAKSTDDYRRFTEDLWRKLFDTFKAQAETQFREFQELSEKSFAIVQNAQSARPNGQGQPA
jgi:hypothetical protein